MSTLISSKHPKYTSRSALETLTSKGPIGIASLSQIIRISMKSRMKALSVILCLDFMKRLVLSVVSYGLWVSILLLKCTLFVFSILCCNLNPQGLIYTQHTHSFFSEVSVCVSPTNPCSRSVCSECFAFFCPLFSSPFQSLSDFTKSSRSWRRNREIWPLCPKNIPFPVSPRCQGPHRAISAASAAWNYEEYFQLCNLKQTHIRTERHIRQENTSVLQTCTLHPLQ